MNARKFFYWTATSSFLLTLMIGYLWTPFIYMLFLVVPYIIIGIHDLFFTTHNILRNYPVWGHLRYMFEFVRPEIQQYFVATNQSGRPFNREIRSVVYQRAQNANDTLPFGTQQEITQAGYDFTYHSLSPKVVDPDAERVLIGGPDCAKPYNASRLNVSAMSYGALGHAAVETLNWGAKMGNFAQDTGEGGLTQYHLKHKGDIILQIGTGNFGFRDKKGGFDTKLFKEKALLDEVKMIEIKLSQGAKPAHGGLLPGAKVTKEIASIRGIEVGKDCYSPSTHTSFNTPLEMMAFIKKLRELCGGKPIGFKLCIGIRSEFLGICKAMLETNILPDFITVDGAEGGTGAAPLEFSNRLGVPINEALVFVNNCLIGTNLRDKIKILASGKVATGFDMMHKIALGADTCNAARAMMFAVGCIQSLKCNTNECPTGVATQDKARNRAIISEHKRFHVFNYHKATIESFLDLTGAIGVDHPDKLKPRHIFHRVSEGVSKNYADLYPELDPGELLRNDIHPEFAKDWAKASSQHF
jgi:glutamate synthase domain-containing protein 2